MPRKRSPSPYSPGPVLKNRRDASATRGSPSASSLFCISVAINAECA
jgi:hypothetical protein